MNDYALNRVRDSQKKRGSDGPYSTTAVVRDAINSRATVWSDVNNRTMSICPKK